MNSWEWFVVGMCGFLLVLALVGPAEASDKWQLTISTSEGALSHVLFHSKVECENFARHFDPEMFEVECFHVELEGID
jgi:hypothetical protein